LLKSGIYFSKHGGNLGVIDVCHGCLKKKGSIVFDRDSIDEDALMELPWKRELKIFVMKKAKWM
jgi:transcriptional/translational regulatory protein YebC/TACO1